MKKILFAISAAAVMFAGCKKTEITTSEAGFGSVSFSISSENAEYITKADLPQVDVSTFKIKITGKDNGYSEEWASVSEMPEILELVSGNYTVTATSPDALPVAFDQPVYGGAKDFAVMVGKVSNVDLKCSITNMMVTINPTDDFLNELTDWEVTVTSEDGKLVWTRTEYDEGKAGFFNVAPLNVLVKGERFDGAEVIQQTLIIDEVAAKDHHIINLDAKVTGSIEAGGLQLTVDNTVNDRNENITIPGLEEIPVEDEPDTEEPGGETGDEEHPVTPAAPTLEWPSNSTFDKMEIGEDMDVNLIIKAPGKIKSVIVRFSDNFTAAISLITIGNVDYLDLVNVNIIPDMVESLKAGGLTMGDDLLGQTQVEMSLSQLVPLISEVGVPGDDYVFTLQVEDELGQTLDKSLTFHNPEE